MKESEINRWWYLARSIPQFLQTATSRSQRTTLAACRPNGSICMRSVVTTKKNIATILFVFTCNMQNNKFLEGWWMFSRLWNTIKQTYFINFAYFSNVCLQQKSYLFFNEWTLFLIQQWKKYRGHPTRKLYANLLKSLFLCQNYLVVKSTIKY